MRDERSTDERIQKCLQRKLVVIHSAFDEKPTTVAFVEVAKELSDEEKCEVAFKKTNTIDKAWWENEGVTKMFGGDACRSTSTGDMVLIGTKKYKCEILHWMGVGMITEEEIYNSKNRIQNVVLQETIVRRILGVGYIGIMSGGH